LILMLRKGLILLATLIIMFSVTNIAFAYENSESDWQEFNNEANALSLKMKELVKSGREDEALSLPEYTEFIDKMEENPELARKYIISMQAINALKTGDLDLQLGQNESRIISFEDGSFIKVASKSNTNGDGNSVLRDPPGIIVTDVDDFEFAIWGAYKVAELHLFTEYEYGYYYAKITDAWTTVKTYLPAWSTGHDSEIVNDHRSRGEFNFQDPAGSFSAILITDIEPGSYAVSITHSDY